MHPEFPERPSSAHLGLPKNTKRRQTPVRRPGLRPLIGKEALPSCQYARASLKSREVVRARLSLFKWTHYRFFHWTGGLRIFQPARMFATTPRVFPCATGCAAARPAQPLRVARPEGGLGPCFFIVVYNEKSSFWLNNA